MKAVRFDGYGGPEVLEVREVDDPEPSAGRVLVRVRASSVNPGEIAIREGALAERWPATFPSGEGSDVAGEVVAVAPDVDAFAAGDEVLGWTHDRAAHAELVAVPAEQLIPKPDGLAWEVAGSMFVAPLAALAMVQAIDPQPGQTVVVSAAAGGVGGVAAQLARIRGATVIGLAGEANHDWLRSRDVVPVAYGDGQADRIRAAAPDGVDGLADAFGGGYVDLAIELGAAPERIATVIDYAATERHEGVRMVGSSGIASRETLTEVTDLAASGELEIPIAATYPLARVRDAYDELSRRHTRGKIVLVP